MSPKIKITKKAGDLEYEDNLKISESPNDENHFNDGDNPESYGRPDLIQLFLLISKTDFTFNPKVLLE